jgi:hypothetical protein
MSYARDKSLNSNRYKLSSDKLQKSGVGIQLSHDCISLNERAEAELSDQNVYPSGHTLHPEVLPQIRLAKHRRGNVEEALSIQHAAGEWSGGFRIACQSTSV